MNPDTTFDASSLTENLKFRGFAVVHDFIPKEDLAQLRAAIPEAQARLKQELAKTPRSLEIADRVENGVVRIPMLFHPYFFKLLEQPNLIKVVDSTLGQTAVMHLMNAFAAAPKPGSEGMFQEKYHRDFPRIVGGQLLSINVILAVTDFSADNGSTVLAPGTHQVEPAPSQQFLDSQAIQVEAPAGSALIFDSTILHRGSKNKTNVPRLFVNLQFTKSWIRQQFDYPRALPPEMLRGLPERSIQMLGFYVRVPTKLTEFYVPAEERLYRGGQG